MKLFARFTISRENAVEIPNEFAGDPATNPFMDRSYAFVIGHNWVIGDNMTNRVLSWRDGSEALFPELIQPDWIDLLYVRRRRRPGPVLEPVSESGRAGAPHSDSG